MIESWVLPAVVASAVLHSALTQGRVAQIGAPQRDVPGPAPCAAKAAPNLDKAAKRAGNRYRKREDYSRRRKRRRGSDASSNTSSEADRGDFGSGSPRDGNRIQVTGERESGKLLEKVICHCVVEQVTTPAMMSWPLVFCST